MYDSGMRLKITLDKETASILDKFADANGISRAKAAAFIVRQRLRPMRIKYKNDFPVTDLSKRGRPITTEFVKSLENEW